MKPSELNPTIKALHDPDADLGPVPWPYGTRVELDGDTWAPAALGGVTENECERCRGHHTIFGAAAHYCPWCGTELDFLNARAHPDTVLADRGELKHEDEDDALAAS